MLVMKAILNPSGEKLGDEANPIFAILATVSSNSLSSTTAVFPVTNAAETNSDAMGAQIIRKMLLRLRLPIRPTSWSFIDHIPFKMNTVTSRSDVFPDHHQNLPVLYGLHILNKNPLEYAVTLGEDHLTKPQSNNALMLVKGP